MATEIQVQHDLTAFMLHAADVVFVSICEIVKRHKSSLVMAKPVICTVV